MVASPMVMVASPMVVPTLMVKCERCPNVVALTSTSKKCQECLDKDSARKQKVAVTTLLENRASNDQQRAVLHAKGLGLPPPAHGSHHCFGCHKDLLDSNFDLTNSKSRCHTHYALRLAGKEAAAEKKKNVLPSSSAAAAASPAVTKVDIAVRREIFHTYEAALEYVELLGHTERVMFIKSSDLHGKCTFRCHCLEKLRSDRPSSGMSCYSCYPPCVMC